MEGSDERKEKKERKQREEGEKKERSEEKKDRRSKEEDTEKKEKREKESKREKDDDKKEEKEKKSDKEKERSKDKEKDRSEKSDKKDKEDKDKEEKKDEKSSRSKDKEREKEKEKEREKEKSSKSDDRRKEKSDRTKRLMASVRLENEAEEKLNREVEEERARRVEQKKKEVSESKTTAPAPSDEEGSNLFSRSDLLTLLSEVKMKIKDKLGGVTFPIPKFIIVGKQSVGKSRLIETLAGEQFNFVSGTLGSRRPTVLEFFNQPQLSESKWYVRNSNNQWEHHPIDRVMKILGDSHECLGGTVSKEEVYVRIESPNCVDMEVVDLPGFREFSIDATKQALAEKIKDLDYSFMEDPNNIMICVEEAGDAANMATLQKCREIDPSFARTILVRNKLDKYYRDLSYENVNGWLDGFGDLPDTLVRFAVTLPHWTDKDKDGAPLPPPVKFSKLRDQMAESDMKEVKSKGASDKYLHTIGFKNFAIYMERRIEEMFAASIGPIARKLKDLESTHRSKMSEIGEEMKDTNPESVSITIRECGQSYAHALTHVMEGFVNSNVGRMTLDEELKMFHNHIAFSDDASQMDLFPCEELQSLDDYIVFLRDIIKVPGMELPLNGGAMYRRLIIEAEVFLRFAEINHESLPSDVVQARGVVTVGQVNWRDVVVKLLSSVAHIPTRRRVRYIAERMRFFFIQQKGAIEDFMLQIKGSSDEQMYSGLYSKHCQIMTSNELIKQLVWDTYDRAVSRQMQVFIDLFASTMASTFSNPWTFLKKSSMTLEDEDPEQDPAEWAVIPDFENTCMRIPWEIDSRGAAESRIQNWLFKIPSDPNYIDEAVIKVQGLVNKIFGYIRAQLADQMELYGEAFFKVPMMRRLEEDMSEIDIDDLDKDTYRSRRKLLKMEMSTLEESNEVIKECLDKLNNFVLKTKGRKI